MKYHVKKTILKFRLQLAYFNSMKSQVNQNIITFWIFILQVASLINRQSITVIVNVIAWNAIA